MLRITSHIRHAEPEPHRVEIATHSSREFVGRYSEHGGFRPTVVSLAGSLSCGNFSTVLIQTNAPWPRYIRLM